MDVSRPFLGRCCIFLSRLRDPPWVLIRPYPIPTWSLSKTLLSFWPKTSTPSLSSSNDSTVHYPVNFTWYSFSSQITFLDIDVYLNNGLKVFTCAVLNKCNIKNLIQANHKESELSNSLSLDSSLNYILQYTVNTALV